MRSRLPVITLENAFMLALQIVVYALPVALIVAWYWRSHSRHESDSVRVFSTAQDEGMIEPPTLHPEIDPVKCIGCRNCVNACPEQDAHTVLGMIGKKAHLIGPTNCIGHGACKAVCPAGAITLVFGTSRRGIDIPQVNPDFETNVPGVFIAGELGGMGSNTRTRSMWSSSVQGQLESPLRWQPPRPSCALRLSSRRNLAALSPTFRGANSS
jgi:ferredoxin